MLVIRRYVIPALRPLPDSEQVLQARKDWQELEDNLPATGLPQTFRDHVANVRHALATIPNEQGDISREDMAHFDTRYINGRDLQQARDDITCYTHADGWLTIWERKADRIVKKSLKAANDSLDAMERERVNPNIRKEGEHLIQNVERHVRRTSTSVRSENTPVAEGENELRNIMRNLEVQARRFRSRHRDHLPITRDTSPGNRKAWLLPVTAGTPTNSSRGASRP